MRARLSILLLGLVLAATSFMMAQQQTAAVPVVDGGVFEAFRSIFIPPLAHAPFNLVLATEWTRPMQNGGSVTLVNQRRIVRDSQGRVYQERWFLLPKNGKYSPRMSHIQIADPQQHTYYNCLVAQETCTLTVYRRSSEGSYAPDISPSGPLPNGSGFHTHEDLGTSTKAGLDTHGYREVTTVNSGVAGNDKPMVTTRGFWYSPQLGFDLVSMVDIPRTGKQSFSVTELSLSEPDLHYFEVPEGYKVVDERDNQAAAQ